jgi:hypothetical protein
MNPLRPHPAGGIRSKIPDGILTLTVLDGLVIPESITFAERGVNANLPVVALDKKQNCQRQISRTHHGWLKAAEGSRFSPATCRVTRPFNKFCLLKRNYRSGFDLVHAGHIIGFSVLLPACNG